MGKDVEVHVAISCENITLFNKYYAVRAAIQAAFRCDSYVILTYVDYGKKNLAKD